MWTFDDRTLVGDYGSGQGLTGDRWQLMQPIDPLRGSTPQAKPGARTRMTDMWHLLDSVFYLLRTDF